MKKILSLLLALALCAGLGVPAFAASGFADVAADSPFAPAIAWAVEKGVTKGTTPTTFGPGETCTAWDENTYRTGTASRVMNSIAEQYNVAGYANGTHTSMQGGCGGLSSLFSDSIFGSGTANPARKVPNNTARPGDIIITLNKDGKLKHVSLATTGITGYDIYTTNSFPAVTELNGGGKNGKIYLSPYMGLPTKSDWAKLGHYDYGYYEVWTRYPTDGTPWTGSSTETSSGGASEQPSSEPSGSGASSSEVNWVTTDNKCGVCGKIGGRQVRSADGGRYACEDCYNDPTGVGKWFVE